MIEMPNGLWTNVVDRRRAAGNAAPMAGATGRVLVTQKVDCLEAALGVIHELLDHIGWLAVEPDARRSVPDLSRQTYADFLRVADQVEQFHLAYQPRSPDVPDDALLLGIVCSHLLDMQVVALDTFLGALPLLPFVEGADLDYLRGVIQTAESVYSSHVSFVRSALERTGPDLVAFEEFCWTGPGSAAAHDVFMRLSGIEFPEFEARVLAQAAS